MTRQVPRCISSILEIRIPVRFGSRKRKSPPLTLYLKEQWMGIAKVKLSWKEKNEYLRSDRN